MIPHDGSVSHNVCYRDIPHFDCSYWIQIDRGDFSCTDIVGEFSIIDPCFQLETYGSYLQSDLLLLRNYALRRCFCEFENYLPQHLENVPHSFAVLRAHYAVAPNKSSVYICRCYFNSPDNPDLQPVDFELSLSLSGIKKNTNERKIQK